MKKNFTRVVALFSVAVILIASCKKDAGKNSPNADADMQKLSSQIATTFYKSITGQYQGMDVSKGIMPKGKTAAAGVLNGVPSLCGMALDSVYNTTVPPTPGHAPALTDTTKKYYGNFHFVYTCDAGLVNGYNVTDSVAYEESGFNFLNRNTLAQKYYVKALDNTYKVVSMDGSISTYSGQFKPYSETGSTFEGIYYMVGLKVDFSSGVADIVSGKTSFRIRNTPVLNAVQHSYTDYYGTLEYLGNHKAKLTVGVYVYTVDLITGVVTPV